MKCFTLRIETDRVCTADFDHDGDHVAHGPGGRVVETWPRSAAYTSEPTRLRIYKEDVGDEFPWHLDAADSDGHCTEDVRRFRTFAEALEEAPSFAAEHGLTA